MLAGRRWFSPWVLRWLSHDPIGYDGGVNLFEYVGGNPVRFVDPSGLGPLDIAQAVRDLSRNYIDMRNANTIGADKYFHCKAQCQAAQRGIETAVAAANLGNLREIFDETIKGDSAQSCNADRFANQFGTISAIIDPKTSCSILCDIFRPIGLNLKY